MHQYLEKGAIVIGVLILIVILLLYMYTSVLGSIAGMAVLSKPNLLGMISILALFGAVTVYSIYRLGSEF